MSYSAYLRDGHVLSLIDEEEGVWHRLTEGQRRTLLRTLEANVDYQFAVAQYPRTTVIEVPVEMLPWEAAEVSCHHPAQSVWTTANTPSPAKKFSGASQNPNVFLSQHRAYSQGLNQPHDRNTP